MANPGINSYSFANRSLDPVVRELRVNGKLRETEPKVFDLIEYLLENRDRVVSKEELQETIWPDVIVTEASLSRAVMKARKALDDHAQEAEVIRTIPRKGFRFVANVREPVSSIFLADGLSDVHYVDNDGVHIAWRTLGEGPVDVFFAPGFVSHLDTRYRIRNIAEFDARLATGRRLITFDKRSVGLSDRIGKIPTIEDTVSDMKAVLDAAGSKKTAIFAVSESGPAACVFAAKYPERVSALILYGTFAKGLRSDDYPHMANREKYAEWLDQLVTGWGTPVSLGLFAPSIADNIQAQDGWARYLRSAATPGVIKGIFEALRETDVRDILPEIRCPTLVLHRKDEKLIRAAAGKDLAERIPHAEYVELEGQDHWWFIGDWQSVLDAMRPYLDSD